MVSNRKLGIGSFSDVDYSDPDYLVAMDSVTKLNEHWKKGQSIWTYFGNPGEMGISWVLRKGYHLYTSNQDHIIRDNLLRAVS